MFDFLTHSFMQYALILGLAIGISAALLSPFLVLNKQAMIADGLSHVSFSGIIFSLLLFDQPIVFAIPFTVLGALFITYLGQRKMIEHDQAIGVVSAFFLSIGLITVSLSSGFNRSIESLLVGSILTVSLSDVFLALGLLVVISIFIFIFYRQLLSSTYDETYAKFSKVKQQLLKYSLSALTAVFIVVGVRTVGMLLISAFIIFPALIASQISRSFKETLLFGVITALVIIFLGLTLSYHLNIPTGSTIVVVYTIVLLVSIGYRKIFKKI